MLWLLAQIKPFVLTLLVGLITGMVFQFYQYSMALSSCSRWLLYMFDFLVWVLILLWSLPLLIINQEIRIYIILALFGGILLYFQTIAPKTQPLIRRAAKTSVYGIRAMAGKAALPWRWLKKQALSWAEQMRKKMEGDEEEE